MRELTQSTTANILVFITDSTDHTTGKALLSLTITASKDGGAFNAIIPTVTERSNGWYNLALTASHTDTLGDLGLHITATGADPVDMVCRIIAMNKADAVRAGLTALPNAVNNTTGGLLSNVTRSGTAQAGTSTTLTLDAGASSVDNYYVGDGIIWTTGANSGVIRVCTGYVGATRVATFAVALPVAADATPGFIITAVRHILPGTDGKALVSTDSQDLSGTLSINTKNIGGQVVTAAAPITVLASVGTAATSTAQTGDCFALIGPTGSGLTSLAPSSTALSTVNWTTARAGYLDNLNIGSIVASQADILAINQSASKHLLIQTVGQYEKPESGSTLYTIEVRTFAANTGAAVNADSTPTLTVTGQTSGDLSSNLSSAVNSSTGVYRWTYTVSNTDTTEPLRFDVSVVINSNTFTLSAYSQVVDLVSATWTSTDASHLTSIFNKLPANNIADETLLLAAIGSPQQVGTKYAVTLSSSDVTGNIPGDLQTIKTQSIICAGPVTIPAATLASTTNITAGVITTTTNLTNLPSIPANWLTSSGITSGALNGKGDWLLASNYTAPDNADITTILADVVTLLSRVPSSVALNSDMQTALTNISTLLTRLTSNRAGYLDNLSAGAVALANSAPAWALTITQVEDAVLDSLASDHNLPNTIGEKINTAGSEGSSIVTGYAAGQDPATLVLDAIYSDHNIPNTVGEKINSGGSGTVTLTTDAFNTITTNISNQITEDHGAGNYVSRVSSGSVIVDHNYGGTDNLTIVTAAGARVADATITCYLRTDWDASRRSSDFIVDSIVTDTNGHWKSPMLLDPDNYILVISKPGSIKTDVVPLLVS